MLEWIFQSARIILADAVQVTDAVVETAAEASAEVTPAIEAVATQAVSTQASTPVDWSLLIAIAALVFSVASPIASAWITGHYQLRQKELEFNNAKELRDQEFYEMHRAEVIERFLRTSGAAAYDGGPNTRKAYGESAAEVYLYIPKKYWGYLDNIDDCIRLRNGDGTMQELTELASKLSEEHIRFKSHEEPKGANKHKVNNVAAE